MLAFISEYQIKFDHGRYPKIHRMGKISLRSSSSWEFWLRDDSGTYLWMWCTASSPLPGVVPWSASSSSSSLPQSLHQNVLSKTILTPACGLAASPVTFDRKISYISSFCLLPPPSSLEKMGCMKGKQVLGRAMTLVDKYTRVLTNLYKCVSSIIERFYLSPTWLILLPLDLPDGVWHASKDHLSSACPTQPSSLKWNIYVQTWEM